jgi:hypothetical protein
MAYNFLRGDRDQPQEDLALRVLAANQAPDHATIARFRVRHQQALAGFLVESLRLCAAAGMVRVGTVALDGTKLAGNAAERANRTLDKLETEVAGILRQAAEADQRDDREHGTARGDELPQALACKAGRLARLRQAKARLEAEAAERQRRYEQRVAASAAARAGARPPRQLKPRPRDEAPNPKATANTTDPDSRFLRTRKGAVQGYNAQAVTTQGGAGRPPAAAPGPGRLRRRPEACVRHPQPAQAVAPHPPVGIHTDRCLSRGCGDLVPRAGWLPHPPGPDDTSDA